MSDDDYRYRIRSPLTTEEKRRRLLARRRYERRFKRIEPEKRRRPQFVMVLLSVLVIALVLYKMFGPELLREDPARITDARTASEAATPAAASDVRLDAEPFRAQVESFESTLFGSKGGSGDLSELSSTLTLSARLLIDRLSSEQSPRLQSLTATLESLNTQMTGSEFALEDLQAVRSSWIEARDQAFHRAAWFGSIAREKSADAGIQTVYRQAASALLDLTERARDEAESIASALEYGEQPSSPWGEFERDFTERLRDIEWSLPEERPKAGAEPAFLAAIQKLELAIEEVGTRVVGSEPSFPLRREPYEEAIETARETIAAFDDLNDSL